MEIPKNQSPSFEIREIFFNLLNNLLFIMERRSHTMMFHTFCNKLCYYTKNEF